MRDAPADDATPLVLTGERTLPGIPDESYWFERHVVAYRLVASRAHGAVVLDAGCGEGYGLALLEQAGARRVIGVDLDQPAVAHAQRTYGSDVVEVHRAELLTIPLDDGTADLTVSFQVIEHLHDIPGYLASLRRVTRPGGTIVIATPNRLTFTPDSDTPVNPFHTVEFSAEELRVLLVAAGLDVAELVGVHHGVLLRTIERLAGRSMTELQLAAAPDAWPRWLRAVVHRTRASWFAVTPRRLDRSLDLVATCRVPA